MNFLFYLTIDSYISKILKTSSMYIICYLHKGTKENKNGRIVSWNYDPAKVFVQRAITIIYSQHHPFETIFFPKYENSFCFILHTISFFLYQKTIQNTWIRENLDVLSVRNKVYKWEIPKLWQFFCKNRKFREIWQKQISATPL